mgnify:CR=1 FL=1
MKAWNGLAKPVENVRRLFYYGYHNDDPAQMFRSSLPIGRVFEDPFDLPPVILCYKLNGQWLSPERGGPVLGVFTPAATRALAAMSLAVMIASRAEYERPRRLLAEVIAVFAGRAIASVRVLCQALVGSSRRMNQMKIWIFESFAA